MRLPGGAHFIIPVICYETCYYGGEFSTLHSSYSSNEEASRNAFKVLELRIKDGLVLKKEYGAV